MVGTGSGKFITDNKRYIIIIKVSNLTYVFSIFSIHNYVHTVVIKGYRTLGKKHQFVGQCDFIFRTIS